MAYERSERRDAASTKIVISGGLGAGKTTFVGAVSEIMPLRTEALVTNASEGVDGLDATPMKNTTTVAMDFGRITLDEDLVLYLFGTPGQRRFWFMWDDLIRMRDQVMGRWTALVREGIDLVGADTPAGERMAEQAAFLEFATKELSEILTRWQKYRAGDDSSPG